MADPVAGDAVPVRVREAIADVARPVCAYVYDTAVLRDRAAALRGALPAGTAVLYAMKANGHAGVVAALAASADDLDDAGAGRGIADGAVDGVEVASGGELAIARAAGARRIAFGGPAKTDEELAVSVRAAVDGVAITVNVESVHELNRLSGAWAAIHLDDPAAAPMRVALRVNRAGPGAGRPDLSGSHRMTGTATPFGIDEAQLDDVVVRAATLPGIDVAGFHLHAVSNNLDAAAHAAFLRDCVSWSAAAAARAGIRLREINAGGGFGIDYTGGTRFDLAMLAASLRGAPRQATASSAVTASREATASSAVAGETDPLVVPEGAQLVVEPGRWLAAPAGWYAAEVIDVKHTHGRWFAVLRGGTHHFRLPAAWGYSHPFTVLPRDAWPHRYPRPEVSGTEIDAVGELCTPRDVLTRGQYVSRVRAGDVLVFGNTGAYGWDISHHDFLRHAYPRIVVI